MVKTRNMNLVETRARAAEQAGGEGGEEGGLDRKGADLRQRGLQHQGQLHRRAAKRGSKSCNPFKAAATTFWGENTWN